MYQIHVKDRSLQGYGVTYAEIRNRRLLVIDEQKGLAVGFSNLYHDSKLKTMKLKVDPGVDKCSGFSGEL